MSLQWRLLFSGESDAYSNMAVDEAILKSYDDGLAHPTLRIYGWKPAGISLGYFQKMEEVIYPEKCLHAGVEFVRRITGGEAIFHTDTLTYSLVCSNKDLDLPPLIKEGYFKICQFLINFYKAMGAEAKFFVLQGKSDPKNKRSGFCFALNRDFDINISGKKIGGNAQRRFREVVFQHGSIPLRLDMLGIRQFFREDLNLVHDKTTSLEEICKGKVDFDQASKILAESFLKTFGVKLISGRMTEAEERQAERLNRDKYSTDAWNYHKEYNP